MLNRSVPIPLYYQVKNIIQRWILEGKFDIYKPITPEITLAEQMGVHRLTVRRAISELVYEGVLLRYPGKGTFIVPKTKDIIKRGDDVYELFGFVGALYAKGKTISVEINEVPAYDLIANRLNLTGDKTYVIEIKRIRTIKETPYLYVKNYLPLEIGRKLNKEMLFKSQLLMVLSKVGIRFQKAIQNIQAIPSDQEVSEALNIHLASPILFVERVIFSEKGMPLCFSQLYYPGNRFKFTMKLNKIKKGGPYAWSLKT